MSHGDDILSRRYATDRIGERGITDRIEATPEERRAVAELLGLEDLQRLSFRFEARPFGKKRCRVRGRLQATATQTCVVTLEPIPIEVDEQIVQEFWPEDDLAAAMQPEEELALDPEAEAPEPIRGGVIDVGNLAYQSFAAGLDPYPRKSGVAFEWKDAAADDEEGHPFGALRALKRH